LVVLQYIKKSLSRGKPVSILWLLGLLNLLLTAGIIFFALAGNFYLALGMVWLVYAMRGANGPLLDLLLNREITQSQVRATVLSMRGQVDQAGQIVGGPFIGWIASRWSVSVGIFTAAIFLVPVVGIYSLLQAKAGKNKVGA
jgi:MFS transporter, DHA3 family, tetracycline resistance protein